MDLTEQQVFDYIFCPTKYDIKHNKKIEVQDPISMPRLLSKVAKFFYLNLVNGKVVSTNELKNKWDSICRTYPDFVDAKKNIAGWGLILQFAQWAHNEKIVVIDVDTHYRLRIGGFEVVGNLETILMKPNGMSELLITNFGDKVPDQIEMDMKLKYTLDALAFKALTRKDLNGIRIRNIKTDRDIFTTRSDPDFKRLESMVKNVGKAIQAEIYYPREQNLCSTCTAKQYCRFWH